MLNLCLFKHKTIFECFRCFWKVFCFYKKKKKWKFQKRCCPVLATHSWVIQVACYSCELAGWFWRLVHEWKVQSRGVHRDFCGSTCDSLVGRPSNREKRLEIFFKSLGLKCFGRWPWRLTGDLFQSQKTCVLCFKDSFYKTFLVFPSNFYDCSLSSPFLSQLKLTQTLLKLYFCIISSQIFKKKVWVLISSPHISCFEFHFREYLCWCFVFCYGFVSDFELSLLRYCSYANLFRLIDSSIIMCWFP